MEFHQAAAALQLLLRLQGVRADIEQRRLPMQLFELARYIAQSHFASQIGHVSPSNFSSAAKPEYLLPLTHTPFSQVLKPNHVAPGSPTTPLLWNQQVDSTWQQNVCSSAQSAPRSVSEESLGGYVAESEAATQSVDSGEGVGDGDDDAWLDGILCEVEDGILGGDEDDAWFPRMEVEVGEDLEDAATCRRKRGRREGRAEENCKRRRGDGGSVGEKEREREDKDSEDKGKKVDSEIDSCLIPHMKSLQELLPHAASMDPASLLDEAIRHVASLQRQLHTLKAKKESSKTGI